MIETAVELNLPAADVARLRIECDQVEANRKTRSGRFTVGTRRRRSPDETVAAIRLLTAERLVAGAIAERLGVTVAHVRRVQRGTPENGAGKPHGYAAEMVLKPEARVTPIPMVLELRTEVAA